MQPDDWFLEANAKTSAEEERIFDAMFAVKDVEHF